MKSRHPSLKKTTLSSILECSGKDCSSVMRLLLTKIMLDFWHSDKLAYQATVAEKIAKLLTQMGEKHGLEKQKQWIDAFFYIFNLHWDKVDNYRIDKYLMFVRYQLNELLRLLKKHSYDSESVLDWFGAHLKRLFLDENFVSKGIPLQICDVFLQELNKVDAETLSYKDLAGLLEPFLYAMGNCRNHILLDRIEEKVFEPMLVNNVTPEEENSDDTDDSEINYNPNLGKKWVDGGKLHPKTQKEVQKLIDQRFHFPSFNILLYS